MEEAWGGMIELLNVVGSADCVDFPSADCVDVDESSVKFPLDGSFDVDLAQGL